MLLIRQAMGRMHIKVYGPCSMHLWQVVEKMPLVRHGDSARMVSIQECYKCRQRRASIFETNL